MSTIETAPSQKQWFGHPRGLATLFMTEMWERFSFYGMRALLFLYMVGSVMKPGLGFNEEQAGSVYGWYTFGVYGLGLLGGFIADRFLGHYRAVLTGGIIIALGHFSMAVPGLPFFFMGLCLIMIGTGLLKPNVSTIVGTLYERDDPRRDAGFSIFYMGINTGAIIGPLICGYLGQKINWHIGFAAAGVGMVAGLIQYVHGRKYLTPVSEAKKRGNAADEAQPAPKEPLTSTDWARIAVIIILLVFAALFWGGFEQAGSTLNLFADRATRLKVFGWTYPSSWFQSVEAVFVVMFAPVFATIWLKLGKHEPSSPAKFALGLLFLSLSFLLVLPAARIFENTRARVSPMWLIGLYFLQMCGELCLSPVGLSMVTKLAPARFVGFLMGIWFLSNAFGNKLAGWVAGFLKNRPFSEVFQASFAIVLAAAIILAILIKPIRNLMRGVH